MKERSAQRKPNLRLKTQLEFGTLGDINDKSGVFVEMLIKSWPNIRFLRALDIDALPTMKITYDREVDALYIRFKETTVTTKHIEDGIALDYDAANHLAGIEILDAAQRVDNPAMLKQISRSDSTCDESDS